MHQLIDKRNKIIIYLILLFILSSINNKNLDVQKRHSITIDEIKVIGLSDSKNLQITNELDYFFYKNIFMIRKEEINEIISKYNVIEQYNIKKIYPSKLSIEIKPTKFIAKISGNKELLVGSNGKIIKKEKTNEVLPYIFGKFRSKEFLEFKKNIDLSKFKFLDLKSIFFFPSNRWDILTRENILIKFPERDLLRSLNLVHKILGRNEFKNIKLIDLRIENNLIIQ
tara:strand:+ start:668 stop:1345 length:678 start_codon:yes stop_codon:yes gene_type:complete